MSGKSLSAARTSCTRKSGCSSSSLSRSSISSCVMSGLPPAGCGDDLDCSTSSALRRFRKSARGKSRSSPAIRKIAPRRGSELGSGALGFDTIASTASSSCSISFPLAILHCAPGATGFTQPHPQILQAAELKLLDTALRSPERGRDFANRFVFRKAHRDHPRLIARQPLDQLEQPRAPLFFLEPCRRPDPSIRMRIVSGALTFENSPLGDRFGAISNFVRCDLEQPRGKRHATPFKPRQVFQCEMEDVRRKILRRVAIPHPPRDVSVQALEMRLI